jgi:hypothetical protein
MVQRYLTKIQIANERLYWLGKASTKEATFTAAFLGLLPSIADASGVFKVGLGKSATSMAATAINASGVVTVSSTTSLSDGDVVTITAVTGTSKDTTNGGSGVDVQGQSYFIQVLSATKIIQYSAIGIMLSKIIFCGSTTPLPADQFNTVNNETANTGVSIAFKQLGATKYHIDIFSGHLENNNTSAGVFDLAIDIAGGVGDNMVSQ